MGFSLLGAHVNQFSIKLPKADNILSQKLDFPFFFDGLGPSATLHGPSAHGGGQLPTI